ncbi:MAG TPA: hypothetical protein VL137_02460 [Polyangiaceae bacterium]|nr:hypothetical protein [Polyangiaceae bacterium]
MRKGISLLTACAVFVLSSAALANGRFPRALRLAQATDDPRFMAVYGTYGLLVSHDTGESWRHICELATGTFSGESAVLEVLPGQHWLLGTDTALMQSDNQDCDWAPALTPEAASQLIDVTLATDGTVFVLANKAVPPNGVQTSVWCSQNHAQSFMPYADLALDTMGRSFTVDVAPSDVDRVYVSGINDAGGGVVAKVTDGGRTVQAFDVPLTSASAAPYIAAVDPVDPDKLFVRTDELTLLNNTITANDRLLYSKDGGQTWVPLIERYAKLLGFALSPDGHTLLVGYGDPVLYSYQVLKEDVGIYRIDTTTLDGLSGDAGAPFEKISDASSTCLRWIGESVFGCFTQDQMGFEVGSVPATDAQAAAALSFNPVLDLTKVAPLQCSVGSTASVCDTDINGWPSVCTLLGAPCNIEDAGGTPTPMPTPTPAPAPTKNKSSCGCRAVGLQEPAGGAACLSCALFFCLIARWRRGVPSPARTRRALSSLHCNMVQVPSKPSGSTPHSA